MPVRDALRQLVSEGLITYTDGGHSIVASQSASDIEDAFYIEAIVHARAAKRATENITDPELTDLEQLHDKMIAAAADKDVMALADLNWQFHRTINRIAKSHKLNAALRTVSLSLPREYLIEFPDSIERGNADHASILAAMRQRDGEAVEQLMQRHVGLAWGVVAKRLLPD
jgi:DNA-binding GntR family transcriptional regulator